MQLSRMICLAVVCLSSWVAAKEVYSNIECNRSCGSASTPIGDNNRALGNKVSNDYSGDTDVWASDGSTTFATNVRVYRGQAWPRLSEGIVTNGMRTPGYPITLNNYLRLSGGRYITYTGQWVRRTEGATPRNTPRGPRYNGAYIWLNQANNVHPGGNPKWPFTMEINVWNRHDNGADKVPHKCADYVDGSIGSNQRYEVRGGYVQRGPDRFYAWFILNRNPGIASMSLNTQALLKHLRDCRAQGQPQMDNLHLVEMTVAAEGHAGADGKFIADVKSMGRP